MVVFLSESDWPVNSSNELKFVVTDDSMAPMILPGEILIVDKSVRDLSRLLVLVHDGKMVVRWVKKSAVGGFELVAGNQDYPKVMTERLHILGSVIATARAL